MSNSKHSGVPEDSKPPTLGVLGFTPTLGQSGVATVMEAIITRSVEKVAFIPLTHVYQPTLESDGAWGVWNQCLPNVIYVVMTRSQVTG